MTLWILVKNEIRKVKIGTMRERSNQTEAQKCVPIYDMSSSNEVHYQ